MRTEEFFIQTQYIDTWSTVGHRATLTGALQLQKQWKASGYHTRVVTVVDNYTIRIDVLEAPAR